MRTRRRARLLAPLAGLLAVTLALPPIAGAAPPSKYTVEQRNQLRTWAADTWESFVAMTNEETGLTSDNLDEVNGLAEYTSPTNIGMYMWAILAARDLQIITPREAVQRLEQTLDTLATFATGQHQAEHGLLMAGSVVLVVPVLAIFIVMQRWITEGISTTGLKG